MKKLICLFILAAAPLSYAQLYNSPRSIWDKMARKIGFSQELEIKNQNGKYVLYGSPEQKRKAINDISRWSESYNQSRLDFERPVVINGILPEQVKNNLYTLHLLNGPNCHNNSLIAAGLMSRRMYVGDQEIKKHLEHFCQEIRHPEPGAIGVQYSKGGAAMHSYVVVSDLMTFEKANVNGKLFPTFRKFSLSRKRADTFFRCRKKEIKKNCSLEVKRLEKELDELHQKVSIMTRSLRGAQERESFKQQAYELENRVFRDSSCPEAQEIIEARIQSIISTFIELEMTGGIYGKGTYDTGPKF